MVMLGHKQLCSCGHLHMLSMALGFPGGSDHKESACKAGDLDWEDPLEEGAVIKNLQPMQERSPEEGNGNPVQYSCLENSMDGRA